jgi:peptidylprolyl isomerase
MQINRKINWLQLCLICTFFCFVLYFSIHLYTNRKPQKIEECLKADFLSEINGYLAWDSEMMANPAANVEAFIRGVQANAAGMPPPHNLSVREMYELTQEVEFEVHRKKIRENLLQSEEFLSTISKKPGVITLVENRLYYELLADGKGTQVVTPSNTYLFHYTVSIPEKGELFDTRKTQRPQKICLDCVIPGFTQGIVGMRVGERRKLYIHPELGFRTMHWTVPPNAILIIDVEPISELAK